MYPHIPHTVMNETRRATAAARFQISRCPKMMAALIALLGSTRLGSHSLSRARTPMSARVFDRLFSGGASAALPTTFRALADGADGAPPSWAQLRERALQTPTGARLAAEDAERANGGGPPHRAAKLRLFGHSPSDVRIKLYRDSAGEPWPASQGARQPAPRARAMRCATMASRGSPLPCARRGAAQRGAPTARRCGSSLRRSACRTPSS